MEPFAFSRLSPDDALFGASLKIKWADQHIKHINESIFLSFFNGFSDKYTVVKDPDSGTQHEVPEFRRVNRVREDIIVMTSYVLHNLRSALDHVACAISTAPHREKAAFVIGDDITEFERVCKEREEQMRLCADAVDFMRGFQPYKGGSSLLWVLNRLNIVDKHRMLIFIVPLGKPRDTMDFRPIDFSSGDWKPFEASKDFWTRPLPSNPNAKTKTAISISFGQVETIENQPIVAVLNDMATLVDKIVCKARDRFPGASPPPS